MTPLTECESLDFERKGWCARNVVMREREVTKDDAKDADDFSSPPSLSVCA